MLLQLRKKFPGREIPAISEVSLTLNSGRVSAIVGPNGAGKTTLFRLIAGVILADQGTITILKNGMQWRRPLAATLLPETAYGFYPKLTVRQNLCYLAGSSSAIPAAIGKAAALNLLKKVNLDDRCEHLCHTLSRGMLQRLNIAVALATNSDVVLLDEPTNGLDISETARFYELIKSLSVESQSIFLFSSHQPDAILGLANSVSFLVDGQIKETLSEETLTSLDNKSFIEKYLSLTASQSIK